MNEEILTKKIKRKSLSKLLLSVPFLVVALLLTSMLVASGMLSTDGYLTPHAVNSISQLDRIVQSPLGEGMYDV